MSLYLLCAEVRKVSVRDALKHAKSQKCSYCREPGASIVCAQLCNKRLHRHCLDSSGCDYEEGAQSLLRLVDTINQWQLTCRYDHYDHCNKCNITHIEQMVHDLQATNAQHALTACAAEGPCACQPPKEGGPASGRQVQRCNLHGQQEGRCRDQIHLSASPSRAFLSTPLPPGVTTPDALSRCECIAMLTAMPCLCTLLPGERTFALLCMKIKDIGLPAYMTIAAILVIWICRQGRPQRQAAKKKISYAEPPLDFDEDKEAKAHAEDVSDASDMSDAEAHDTEDDDDVELDHEVHA
jgi:Shugoshin C terminus